MSRDPQRLNDDLAHILEAISRVAQYTAGAHGYFKVDLEIVWRTIQHDLPALKQAVSSLHNGA